MKQIKMNKKLIVLFLEAAIAFILILSCLDRCVEYTLDKNNFKEYFDGSLQDFGDDYVGIEEQELEPFDILEYSLNLGNGAYSIKVLYDSVSNYEIVNTDNCAGQILLDADNLATLKMSNMQLQDGLKEMQSRFWLSQLNGTGEVKVRVRYYGNGKLAIKCIQVKERREYKILLCIAMICLMVLCNIIYIVFIRKDDTVYGQRNRIIIAGIMGITLLSSMTYFADFIYAQHDTRFHLSRIISLAYALKEFQIPHRIQFEALNGYGYAAPLFYGELLLLLPAILYNLYLPIQTCYQIFVFFVNLITTIISCWCFTRMSCDWKKGLFGAFIYTLAAYRLTDVIIRAAVGEYATLIFLPLLIYGFWHIYCKDANEKIILIDYIPVILSATGIINSHILSCEMVLLFVILFMIINYKKTFQKNILVALIKCGICTFLLNMWFIIPFIQSMGMNINVNNKEIINILGGNTVYLFQLFGVFHTSKGYNTWYGAKDEMPLSIGLPITICICIFLYIYIKKDEWNLKYDKKMKVASECFIMGLIALFLSSNLCKWDNLKHVSEELARIAGMVQFPWRYLGIATALLVTMAIFVLQILEEHLAANSYKQIVVVLIASVIITEGHFMMEHINLRDEDRVYSQSDVALRIGNGEYLLQGKDLEDYKNGKIVYTSGENIECSELYYDKNGKYYLSCTNKTDVPAYIDVPIQAYNNYHAYTSDREELFLETSENNVIRVFIPEKYDGTICIKYVIPILWRLCEIISLITMCTFGVVLVRYTLKNRKAYEL